MSHFLRSAPVWIPSLCILAAVTFPIPKNFSMGSFSINPTAFSGAIRYNPSGLSMSDAIFARNLLTDIPADAVSPVLSFISFLICLAITVADPIPFLSRVTSRKASSIERGSTRSVYSLNISNTFPDISWYLSKRCFTKISPGHSLSAVTEGMAE